MIKDALSTIKLPKPAQRALAGAGITSLKQLSGYMEHDIKLLHGIGLHAMNEIKRALDANGLAFKKQR